MLYAARYPDVVLIAAADNLMEFEDFANNLPSGEGYSMERADILDMLGDPIFKPYASAPVKLALDDPSSLDGLLASMPLTVVSANQASELQTAMIERARLESEIDLPPDRRTLAEVHGLTENDPWDKSTDEQKEAARKDDERMKAVRAAGGLTGDSFASKVGEKLTVHGGTVFKDASGEVTGVDLSASKNSIHPYELTVEGEAMEWEPFWDELKIPENRVLATSGNRTVVQLHDFQTGEVAEVLDRAHRTYTLTRQETISALDDDAETMPIDGHETINVFYSVQIEHGTVHEMVPLLGATGFDTGLIVTMRNIGSGCWLAFTRDAQAQAAATLCRDGGHACSVVAINRLGQPIVAGGGEDVRVVDNFEVIEVGPRPWNHRAGEIEGMTDEEKAAYRKSVQAEEYLMIVEPHDVHRTIVYITPESYFREHDAMWTGEIVLDMVPNERQSGTVMLTEISPGIYKGGLEPQLMKDNLCRWGFVESLLLRIHLNDMLSEQRSASV